VTHLRPTKDQEEAAQAISNFINRHGSSVSVGYVAELMANDHPTLQQGIMRMFVAFVREMAKKEYSDARNEASVNLAKTLVDEWGPGPYDGPHLPRI
jgi:hypothetical protein